MLTVTTDAPQDALEPVVDAEIAAFDDWFQQEMKNEPLVNPEKAILKTFLWWKLRGHAHTQG